MATNLAADPAWNLEEVLEQPFHDFVVKVNGEVAGGAIPQKVQEPEFWDRFLYRLVCASVEQHAQSWVFFERLDATAASYHKALQDLRAVGLPDVFAAIPFREHGYREATPYTFQNAWGSEFVRQSGSAVEIAILSHRLGWDRRRDVRPRTFPGPGPGTPLRRQFDFADDTGAPSKAVVGQAYGTWRGQHRENVSDSAYPYTVIAIHMLAVCYYGANYTAEYDGFAPFAQYSQGDGYCQRLNIPMRAEVGAWSLHHAPDE